MPLATAICWRHILLGKWIFTPRFTLFSVLVLHSAYYKSWGHTCCSTKVRGSFVWYHWRQISLLIIRVTCMLEYLHQCCGWVLCKGWNKKETLSSQKLFQEPLPLQALFSPSTLKMLVYMLLPCLKVYDKNHLNEDLKEERVLSLKE